MEQLTLCVFESACDYFITSFIVEEGTARGGGKECIHTQDV